MLRSADHAHVSPENDCLHACNKHGGTTKAQSTRPRNGPDRYLYVICGQLISVIRSAALVGECDRGLLAAAIELEHPLALDAAEQAVGALVRDSGP
jgi:hypothetical protein